MGRAQAGVFLTLAGPKGEAVGNGPGSVGSDLLDSLRAAGDPFVPLRAETYRPASFEVAGTVTVHPDHEEEKVLAAVRESLRDRFSFEAREFGQPVMLSEVIAVLHSVAGVIAVDVDHLQRTYKPESIDPAPRLLAEFPGGGLRCGRESGRVAPARAGQPRRNQTGIMSNPLIELLPAIHRLRDHEQGGALRELLDVVAQQVAVLEEDLEQLYDDQFIETCADWVVPYIGDLIGYRSLHHSTPGLATPRAEVANTIGHRRRKGTVAMLEQLARDVTGWPAKVVEFFQLLADNPVHEPCPAAQRADSGLAALGCARGARRPIRHARALRGHPLALSRARAGTTSRTSASFSGGWEPIACAAHRLSGSMSGDFSSARSRPILRCLPETKPSRP